MTWNSRQYDEAACLPFFGNRVLPDDLEVLDNRMPFSDSHFRDLLDFECEQADITLLVS